MQVYTTTASEQHSISYPTSIHSNDILGESGYKNHTVINVEHEAIDTDFLTIFYPTNSDQININTIENDTSYIAVLVNRLGNFYDIIIAQNQNNQVNIDGFTSFWGIQFQIYRQQRIFYLSV